MDTIGKPNILDTEDADWIKNNMPNPETQSPEAPASITIKGYFKGYSVLITNRDPKVDVGPLLAKAMNGINWMIENGFKPSWADDTNGKNLTPKEETKTQGSKVCPTCGGQMVLKEGISKKNGKRWAGYFCPNNDSDPEFINLASKK